MDGIIILDCLALNGRISEKWNGKDVGGSDSGPNLRQCPEICRARLSKFPYNSG